MRCVSQKPAALASGPDPSMGKSRTSFPSRYARVIRVPWLAAAQAAGSTTTAAATSPQAALATVSQALASPQSGLDGVARPTS